MYSDTGISTAGLRRGGMIGVTIPGTIQQNVRYLVLSWAKNLVIRKLPFFRFNFGRMAITKC